MQIALFSHYATSPPHTSSSSSISSSSSSSLSSKHQQNQKQNQQQKSSETPQYILVIDAGSSSTRLNAYTWTSTSESHHFKNLNSMPPLPELPSLTLIPPDASSENIPKRAIEKRRAYNRVETEPGLEKFSHRIHETGPVAIAPLLTWAKAVVPSSSWSNTPIFLFGTAGMRRMKDRDRSFVLEEVRRVLSLSGFRFEPHWARVLTGLDEGVYGWIALNAVAKTLGTKRTLGALDLGGSSLEVTFALDDSSEEYSRAESRKESMAETGSPSTVKLSFLGIDHVLYSHSHRHFGLDDAFERSVSLLLKKNSSDAESARNVSTVIDPGILQHPCLHRGYSEKYSRIPLYGSKPVPTTVTLQGQDEYSACARLAASVVASTAPCTRPPCALGAPQPKAKSSFVALSGFYVVSHFFDIKEQRIDAVRSRGRDFCAMPWDTVQAKHAGEMAVESYCFRSLYVFELIRRGLGIAINDVRVIGGDNNAAGWTLGAALYEGHRLAGLGARDGGDLRISSADTGVEWASLEKSKRTNFFWGNRLSSSATGFFGSAPTSWELIVLLLLISCIVVLLMSIVTLALRSRRSMSQSLGLPGSNPSIPSLVPWKRINGTAKTLYAHSHHQSYTKGSNSVGGNAPHHVSLSFSGLSSMIDSRPAVSAIGDSVSSSGGSGSTITGNGGGGVDGAVAYRSSGMPRSHTYSRRLSQLENGGLMMMMQDE